MRQRPLLSLVSVWIAVMAVSTPARAENLLDIYRLARSNDPTWAAAEAGYQASIEKGPQGRALLLPAVIFTANAFQNTLDRTQPSSLNSSYASNGYTLQLTQPLYRKSNFAAYVEGKLSVTQAQAQLAIARQDLIVRTAQAYFNVLAAEDAFKFATSKKTAIAGQLDLAKRNFEVGNSTIVDVNAAQAQYDSTVASEVAADNDLRVKKETLATITNTPVGTLAALGQTLPLQMPEPADMSSWTKAAEDQSPQIKVQQQAVSIARQEVEKNRAGHYPTLDLIASHSYSYGSNPYFPGALAYNSDQVGVELQLPIFSGGAVSSQVRQSLALEDQARATLIQTERQIILQTRQYYLAVTSGAAQVKALEQALLSNQKALESTQLGYRTGVNTGLDVLNAQQNLFSAESDLSQAKYNYLLSKLQLKEAVGTLSEDDLIQVNNLLTGQ